jgi:hypothetical protein
MNEGEHKCCHGNADFAGVFDVPTFKKNFGNGRMPQ